jgi:hypothetical protein
MPIKLRLQLAENRKSELFLNDTTALQLLLNEPHITLE